MKRRFRLIFAVILSTLFTFNISSFVLAKAPDGSRIANVLVEGKDETDIYNYLVDRVNDWLKGDDFILMSHYERIAISRDIFEFDIQGTIDQFEQEIKRSISSFFKKQKAVEMPLKVFIKQNHPDVEYLQSLDYIDSKKVLQRLLPLAENLQYDSVEIVYFDETNLPFEEVATYELSIPDDLSFATVKNFSAHLNGQLIKPMKTFSFLESIEIRDSLKNANEELSFVATGLYKILLQTDIDIVKRHHHLQVPNYASPGLDILINRDEGKDFIIQNNSDSAYEIYTSIEDRKLHVSIHTLEQSFTYDYEVKNEASISPRTIYRYSDELKPGETEVIQTGEDGLSIETYRTTFSENDEIVRTDLISKDVYLPTPKILLASTEDAPEESDEVIDPDEIDEELDDMEESIVELNRWLTGDTRDDVDGEDHDQDELTLRPFFYLIPANFVPFLTDQDEDFVDRFAKLEEMIKNNEQLTDEVVLTRLVELEARLESLKEQYESIAETLVEHDLLKKGDK